MRACVRARACVCVCVVLCCVVFCVCVRACVFIPKWHVFYHGNGIILSLAGNAKLASRLLYVFNHVKILITAFVLIASFVVIRNEYSDCNPPPFSFPII